MKLFTSPTHRSSLGSAGTSLLLGLSAAGLPALGLAATFGAPAAPPIVTAPAAALAPGEGDLEEIEILLQLSPDDPELLLKASEACFAEAEDDRALWYAELARIAADGTKKSRDVEKKVRAIRDEIGIEVPMLGQAIDAYSKEIFNYAKLAKSKGYYANAADLLGSLMGSPYERDAQSNLEKLFKKSDAIKAMLDAGVPVKVEVKKRMSDAKLRKLNAKHSDWENAYEAKGTNYTIVTDMGVDMAEQFLGAMEQMNVFYRQVFDHKARGGKMRRCEVKIWKSREEFDRYNDVEANVAGFFRPGDNSVSAYDPRTEEGSNETMEDLWSTLYHEASHQFTRAVWKLAIPTWLNEGTASYFEGAALLTGGVVETNRIPRGRLNSLVWLLGINDLFTKPKKEGESAAKSKPLERYEPHDRSPGLKAVVSYIAPGSYPGEYYSFGWGLVYFCLNFENDEGERVYAPIYKDFMRSYTETGGEKPFKRFVTYFIDEAGVKDIETFEDFENQWIDWIAELARREFGGPNQADKLITQGRQQIQLGHPDYAIQSLRWALRKRADDPTALELLGQAYREVKDKDKAVANKDAALFTYRTLAMVARRAPELDEDLDGYDGTAAEALKVAIDGMTAVDEGVGSRITEGIPSFVDATLAEADAWIEAGYPQVGLQAIAMATEALGGDGRLRAKTASIAEDSGATVARTRRLPVEDLAGWQVSGGPWEAEEEGNDRALFTGSNHISEATLVRLPPRTFRFEVDIDVSEAEGQPLPGITFAGSGGRALSFVRMGASGRFGFLEYDPKTGEADIKTDGFKRGARSKEGTLTMGIEVRQDETDFIVDDKVIKTIKQSAAAVEGQIGFTCWGATRFTNPRLTY